MLHRRGNAGRVDEASFMKRYTACRPSRSRSVPLSQRRTLHQRGVSDAILPYRMNNDGRLRCNRALMERFEDTTTLQHHFTAISGEWPQQKAQVLYHAHYRYLIADVHRAVLCRDVLFLPTDWVVLKPLTPRAFGPLFPSKENVTVDHVFSPRSTFRWPPCSFCLSKLFIQYSLPTRCTMDMPPRLGLMQQAGPSMPLH